MSFSFSFYKFSPFSQTCLFSQEREVHLQYCSSPCSFWFSPDVVCLVSWLSCLFIATALLSHFHFPICAQHSWPASLQECAPKACFLTVTSPLPTASGPREVKSHRWPEQSILKGKWLEQFPLTAAHDLSIKILQ